MDGPPPHSDRQCQAKEWQRSDVPKTHPARPVAMHISSVGPYMHTVHCSERGILLWPGPYLAEVACSMAVVKLVENAGILPPTHGIRRYHV